MQSYCWEKEEITKLKFYEINLKIENWKEDSLEEREFREPFSVCENS